MKSEEKTLPLSAREIPRNVRMSNKRHGNGTAKCDNVFSLLTPVVVAFNCNKPRWHLQCTSMCSWS